jgi:hypothetical protein
MYRGRVNSSGRSEAIDHGLADRIGSLRDLLASSSRSHIPAIRKEHHMDTVTRAEHEAAVAAARSEVANAERQRINAIMSLEECKGRRPAEGDAGDPPVRPFKGCAWRPRRGRCCSGNERSANGEHGL